MYFFSSKGKGTCWQELCTTLDASSQKSSSKEASQCGLLLVFSKPQTQTSGIDWIWSAWTEIKQRTWGIVSLGRASVVSSDIYQRYHKHLSSPSPACQHRIWSTVIEIFHAGRLSDFFFSGLVLLMSLQMNVGFFFFNEPGSWANDP